MFRSTFALAAVAGLAAAQQGYGYGASTTTSAPATYTPSVPDAETCNCYLKLSDCQTAPDANQSFCASQFASCANYNPYALDSAGVTAYFNNLEKYCTATPSSYTTTTPAGYSTPTASTTATGPPSAATCACYEKLGECQTAPNANQAYCASQFAQCVQYNPYTGDSAAVTAYFDNLKKYCTATTSTPPSYSSTPSASSTGSSPPSAATCACYATLGQCQTAPNANQAYCASQFAQCVQYNPYTGDSAAVTAYFDNLKKYCSATTSANAPPVSYTASPTAANAPPVYSTLSSVTSAPQYGGGNGTVPSATQTNPAVYTGAAVPVKAAGPVVAAMAFGALFM